MPDLVIPILNATVHAQLRVVAAMNGRSLEDEAQRLLTQAVSATSLVNPAGGSNDDISPADVIELTGRSGTMRVSGGAQIGLLARAVPEDAADSAGPPHRAQRG